MYVDTYAGGSGTSAAVGCDIYDDYLVYSYIFQLVVVPIEF